MAKIVEIKKMWHAEIGRKMLIMFLDCGHGFVHIGNQEVGETVCCSKCKAGIMSYEMRRRANYDESRYGGVTTAERSMRMAAGDCEDVSSSWATKDRGGWSFASLWAEGWNGPFRVEGNPR